MTVDCVSQVFCQHFLLSLCRPACLLNPNPSSRTPLHTGISTATSWELCLRASLPQTPSCFICKWNRLKPFGAPLFRCISFSPLLLAASRLYCICEKFRSSLPTIALLSAPTVTWPLMVHTYSRVRSQVQTAVRSDRCPSFSSIPRLPLRSRAKNSSLQDIGLTTLPPGIFDSLTKLFSL